MPTTRLVTGCPAMITGKRVMFPTPETCWTKTMTAEETAGSRKATITHLVSQTRFLRAGPSARTTGTAGSLTSHGAMPGVVQNDHPSGGGGQSGGGLQPGGGLHPTGGGGQFGGDRHCQSTLDIARALYAQTHGHFSVGFLGVYAVLMAYLATRSSLRSST